MPDSVFVDTNVFVYALDTDEPRKRSIALDVLSNPAHAFVTSTQVLAELYVTVTRKLRRPLPAADAAKRIEELSNLPVVSVDVALVRAAIALSEGAHLSYWDSAVVVAAASAGCRRLMTEDLQHGMDLAGVRIENPFRVLTQQ